MSTISGGEPGELDIWAGEIAAITAEGSGHGSLTERSIGSLLRVIREQLNLEVVFVGQFVDGNRVFRQISSKSIDAIIRPGDSHPRIESPQH